VFDLLASPGPHRETNVSASLKRRKSDGRVVLCNASRLQLQAPSDFDRVMGLLLGKRTALQGVLATLQQQRALQREAGVAHPNSESIQDIIASIDPWAAFNSRSAAKALETAACASTMLITVSVTGGAASSGQTSADFNFISPCGKNWCYPGKSFGAFWADIVERCSRTLSLSCRCGREPSCGAHVRPPECSSSVAAQSQSTRNAIDGKKESTRQHSP
jgi:hypothetical protein